MSNQDIYETIYKIYPRQVGKIAALKAIEKQVKWIKQHDCVTSLVAARRLYRATKAYSESLAGKNPDRQFIPMPATWFNRGSYMDDPREWNVGSELEVKPLTLAEKMRLDGFE